MGLILMVVPWPQASKNTNGPLKCLSGKPGWPEKIICENALVLMLIMPGLEKSEYKENVSFI